VQGGQGVEEEDPSEVGQPRVHGPAEARWQRRLDGAGEAGALQHRTEELVEIAGRVARGVRGPHHTAAVQATAATTAVAPATRSQRDRPASPIAAPSPSSRGDLL